MTEFNQRSDVAVEAILYTGENADAVIEAGGGHILPGRHGRLMIDPPDNPNWSKQGPTRQYGHARNNLSGPNIILPGSYVINDEIRGVWYSLDKDIFEALYSAGN